MSLQIASSATVLMLLLAGCQTTPIKPQVALEASAPEVAAPTPAADAGPAPDDNLNALVWQQTSVEYQLIAEEIFLAATRQIDAALQDPHRDALTKEDRDVPAAGLPPAIIVDIDEAVLDNSPYQARLIRDQRSYDEFSWSEWVREAAASAVPGALEFTQAAAARGITVYYVTNRAQDLSDVTFENLKKLGFPIADRSQFLGLGTLLDGCEEMGSEKGCRRRLVGRTHRVLMQVGDQIVDMVTVIANTPAGRLQAVEPYRAWLGERWFVLPNPTYGSWEPALFNNDWSQPAPVRRQQKIEALRF